MGQPVIQHADRQEAKMTIPQTGHPGQAVDYPRTLHVILEVTDRGEPALTRYRRVIVTVEK